MARQRLRQLVARQAVAKPLLPSVHTTDVYRFVNALQDGELSPPRPCNVFVGEPLIYFFYGRPSYRVNSDEPPSSLDHYLPVCLLFRAASIHPIKRVFPFDSGGFHNDFYADAMHRDMGLEDFGIEPTPNTPGRVISLFFGSVELYLKATPVGSLDLDPSELEAISYHALISQRLSNSADNRVSGIEIQLEGKLALNKNVEAVILPGPMADSVTVKAKLDNFGIVPLPYPQIARQRPSEYVTKIFDICYEYYRRMKLLNDSGN